MHLTDWLVELQGHKRRVAYIEWHPIAENILFSAGFDYLVRYLNFMLGLNKQMFGKRIGIWSNFSLGHKTGISGHGHITQRTSGKPTAILQSFAGGNLLVIY
jgi:hypothetical protein